jgi:hypothetical protein
MNPASDGNVPDYEQSLIRLHVGQRLCGQTRQSNTKPERSAVMHRRNISLAIFGLIFILLSGCASVPIKQQTTTPRSTSTPQTNAPQAVTLVKPAGSIPATCTPTPVYFGGNNDNLAIPWIVATPSTSGIIGYLFFAHVAPTNKPEYYQPMHTGGKMPDGGTTKILWMIQDSSAIGELTVTGKNFSLPRSTFQQTFSEAGAGIPSILDVPTAGCWHLDLTSGSDHAMVIFWVEP